jgi:hypothetical protein
MEKIKVTVKEGKFIIMNNEYPVQEYRVFTTKYYNIYLHKSYPPVYYQKKWVGKWNHYLGIPELMNAQVVKSPKGNLVTNAAGTWGPVVNATKTTKEGEYHIRLSPEETLRRGKPMYVICPN